MEKLSAFHPFISFLVANKFASPVELTDPAFATKTGLDGKKIKSRYAGHNPVFTRLLLPNETFTLLDTGLQRSRLARSRGEIELHRLALAAGHADEIVELMRGVWERREVEIAELLEASGKPTGRACESWIDVKGVKVCGVEKFWQTVGAKAKVMHGPIKIVAKG